MNEPEPSAVANGSPPQASPFPFGPAADPTPTDDAGNPLRRMRRDTLFCRSSYDSCRRPGNGTLSKTRTSRINTGATRPAECKETKIPSEEGLHDGDARFVLLPDPFRLRPPTAKNAGIGYEPVTKSLEFHSSASRRQVRPPERPPSRRDSAAPQPPDSLRADRPPSASRASERLWGTSRAHVRAA